MDNSYDIIIVGGGPAGITAGIYSVRYGMKTLLIEKYAVGGLMNTTTEIKNFPSYQDINGAELSTKMLNHYQAYNGEMISCVAKEIDFENKMIKTSKGEFKYKALIVATGSTPRKLELENEAELTGHGISYCAICDGYFFKGKDVVVVGSGNSAIEDAIYLSDLCKSVAVVSKYDKFVAQDILIKQLKAKKNVKYYMGYATTKIFGEDEFCGVELKSNKNGDVERVYADGMFIQIGHKPDNSLVKDKLKMSPAGFVEADEKMQTSQAGVFVAGDIRNKTLRQIITACGDGAIASNSAYMYLESLK